MRVGKLSKIIFFFCIRPNYSPIEGTSSINKLSYFDGDDYPHWKAYKEFFLENERRMSLELSGIWIEATIKIGWY